MLVKAQFPRSIHSEIVLGEADNTRRICSNHSRGLSLPLNGAHPWCPNENVPLERVVRLPSSLCFDGGHHRSQFRKDDVMTVNVFARWSRQSLQIGLVCCLLLIFGIADRGLAEDRPWNQYRGPDGNGHSAASGLPTQFAENSQAILWKLPVSRSRLVVPRGVGTDRLDDNRSGSPKPERRRKNPSRAAGAVVAGV